MLCDLGAALPMSNLMGSRLNPLTPPSPVTPTGDDPMSTSTWSEQAVGFCADPPHVGHVPSQAAEPRLGDILNLKPLMDFVHPGNEATVDDTLPQMQIIVQPNNGGLDRRKSCSSSAMITLDRQEDDFLDQFMDSMISDTASDRMDDLVCLVPFLTSRDTCSKVLTASSAFWLRNHLHTN